MVNEYKKRRRNEGMEYIIYRSRRTNAQFYNTTPYASAKTNQNKPHHNKMQRIINTMHAMHWRTNLLKTKSIYMGVAWHIKHKNGMKMNGGENYHCSKRRRRYIYEGEGEKGRNAPTIQPHQPEVKLMQ